MSVLKRIGGRVHSVRSCVAVAAVLVASTSVARSSDNGLLGFFQQTFGGGAPSSEPLPQPDGVDPDSPPLTVRIHPHRHRPHAFSTSGSPRMTADELKTVTIYTDKTLARGDAVMTAKGIRIFNGSESWPYKDDDFVALSSGRISKTERKELSAMDVASRPELMRR